MLDSLDSLRSRSTRPVAIWVYAGVIMLLIQVVLGGITRLTGSGLSITEWNVVTGAVPPLNEAQWSEEFAKYRATPQYQLLNSGFTISDFKFIFFWEWFHRFWARLVGVVFLVGFFWLLAKGAMKKWMVRPLNVLFLLGALQGAIGWIMVASGLTGDAIYVKPTKLALHFVFALGLIVYTFWFALQLSVPKEARLSRDAGVPKQSLGRLQGWTIVILAVLFFQLLYGALMAGHKAATVAPTWPTINGSWIPDSLFGRHPLLEDLAGNRITIHFIHRGLAYLLVTLVIVWSVKAGRVIAGTAAGGKSAAAFRRLRWLPLALILVQVTLGICSLLTSPGIVPQHWGLFDWLAQLHQIVGLLFLLTMIGMLYLVVRVHPEP
ncbi:MAG: COX15/CtaA family protein [Bacteroidetes bacterium]|nr:COX15/CtaA family protein [Bacteroidota bacterium]